MGSYRNNDRINSCKMIYDFDLLLTNKEFEAFNSKMFELDKINKMNHTMIGFNYNIEQIVSTKFYYTFYGDSNIDKSFPIPELNEVYKKIHLKISNYHLKEKFVPGGGITFVIKFDNCFNVTRGFFFRVNDDNRKLINNLIRLYPELNFTLDDFENGFGQYVLINKNGIEYNEYLYLKNKEKVNDSYGINFSLAKTIEISSSKSKSRKYNKFIAIGGNETITHNFLVNLPQQISHFDTKLWVCPAVCFDTGIRTIYSFNNDRIRFTNKHS